ncbi:uncharacterized protein LOC134527831 [Bacillus rossius redtenbacheri]|uniref:uncharacterized protein LOC134527831 n=1 Tax=Bacillus rossius redtenbacheri TaxID=93214 RepID=UPI002FDD7B72
MRAARWVLLSCLLVAAHGGCLFPSQWSGRWFQSGVPHLIAINTSVMETKGQCVENLNDKYIIEDKMDNCHRCLVIYEKHPNVLQYKETYCDQKDSLDRLCSLIPGDATLISMFRSGAGATQCPFKGGPPYTFSYNKGSGECSQPPSIVDSCTDESRLLLRYQACPDVYGTESTTEELVCLASWKDGNTRYLVGKIYHAMAHSDEDRYRCFAYEKHASPGSKHVVYNVAQSGDATCNGLLSATEGSRTMKLVEVENHSTRCRYPAWVTDHHHWHTLDHRHSYHFSTKNATLKITEEAAPAGGGAQEGGATVEKRVVCHTMEASTERQAMLVAHLTTGCQSGYVCMVFYRRDWHVLELQISHPWTQIPEEACMPQNFNPSALPFTTLITATPRSRQCPYLGRYSVTGAAAGRQHLGGGAGGGPPPAAAPVRGAEGGEPCGERQQQFHTLAVGCAAADKMEFHSACGAEPVSTYSCHGSWEDNGTSYLIVSPSSRKSVGARRYCFIYTEAGVAGADERIPALQVTSVTESCHRNAPPSRLAWTFNLTAYGQCSESSAERTLVPSLQLLLAVVARLAALHSR